MYTKREGRKRHTFGLSPPKIQPHLKLNPLLYTMLKGQ